MASSTQFGRVADRLDETFNNLPNADSAGLLRIISGEGTTTSTNAFIQSRVDAIRKRAQELLAPTLARENQQANQELFNKNQQELTTLFDKRQSEIAEQQKNLDESAQAVRDDIVRSEGRIRQALAENAETNKIIVESNQNNFDLKKAAPIAALIAAGVLIFGG